MPPFRRSQSRQWGGAPRLLYRRGQIDDVAAPRWFHGFDGAGLWYRRRAAGHDADGTIVDVLTKIDGDTIILKRHAGPAPIKFPNPHPSALAALSPFGPHARSAISAILRNVNTRRRFASGSFAISASVSAIVVPYA